MLAGTTDCYAASALVLQCLPGAQRAGAVGAVASGSGCLAVHALQPVCSSVVHPEVVPPTAAGFEGVSFPAPQEAAANSVPGPDMGQRSGSAADGSPDR